ncbi:hypothetical protein MMC10_002764 [Thelotrema lepadinum]|nr:hypothetical protein [Thelotrema lepadinum]
MALSTTAAFIRLPIELRFEIYSYVLLSFNSVTEKRTNNSFALRHNRSVLQLPQISTGLFTVNKQISLETLYYFYKENAFVAIKTLDGDVGLWCQYLFPHFLWLRPHREAGVLEKKTQCLQRVGLVITINEEMQWPLSEPDILVFSVRYLPTVVLVLNNIRLAYYNDTHNEVQLDFRLESSNYKRSRKTADIIMSSLKSLKTFYTDDNDDSSCTTFSISGDIDEKQALSLQTTSLPCHSRMDLITDAEWAHDMGDIRSRRGDFDQAENYYNEVYYLLFHCNRLLRDEYPRERHLLLKCSYLGRLRLLKIASSCHREKDYKWARICAAMAIEANQGFDDDRSVRMQYQATIILSESGDFEREKNLCCALGLLRDALSRTSDAELKQEITATIEKVETDLSSLGVENPVPLDLEELLEARSQL